MAISRRTTITATTAMRVMRGCPVPHSQLHAYSSRDGGQDIGLRDICHRGRNPCDYQGSKETDEEDQANNVDGCGSADSGRVDERTFRGSRFVGEARLRDEG